MQEVHVAVTLPTERFLLLSVYTVVKAKQG